MALTMNEMKGYVSCSLRGKRIDLMVSFVAICCESRFERFDLKSKRSECGHRANFAFALFRGFELSENLNVPNDAARHRKKA